MKIALITIHNANNYGAVLQVYATKKILSEYGEVTTINYDNKHLSHQLDIIRFSFSIHGIKMFIHDILRLPKRIKTINKFKNFIHTNMNLTEIISSKDLLDGKVGNFDAYICGSDQIWNPNIVNKNAVLDPIYFLNFGSKNSKKISYASSVGAHKFTENEKKQVKNLLSEFTKISVRESESQMMFTKLLKKEVQHVLDPTLLLSKEEWLRTLDIDLNLRSIKENYILVYSVPKSSLIKPAVAYYQKELGLKVVIIDQGLKPFIKSDYHIDTAGPKDFIKLFAHADFIITDSFHGTCFSVNFNKEFISVYPQGRAHRIESLLKLLHLEERVISKSDNFIKNKINYSQVNKLLLSNRNKSKEIFKCIK